MSQASTAFHLSVYGLAAVASLMLGIAEGQAYPQTLTVPFAILAYFFVERGKVIALPTLLANIAGVVAFCVIGWEFYRDDLEGRILAGAHLLVYLSWIVLFQKKKIVEYWWMCALGVLQVAVGAVLTNNETYGAMLVGYMMFSIWTLSLFSLHQAQLQFGVPDKRTGSQGARQKRESGRGTPTPGEAEASLTVWLRRPSVSRGAIQHDPSERWLGPQFVLTNLGTSLLAIVVASCFFLFIPRLWAGRTEWPTGQSELGLKSITGFEPKVRLGDFGEILESTEKAFEVRIFDNDTGRELDVEQYATSIGLAEPLFRGTMLADYENGTWTGFSRADLNTGELPNQTSEELIRQEILLQPIGTDILFAMQPVISGRLSGRTDEINVQPGTGVLYRPTEISTSRPLGYTLYTEKSTRNTTPGGPTIQSHGTPVLNARIRRRCSTEPGEKLARLTNLAREVSGFNSPNPPPKAEQINRIYTYLRHSGEFSYSLDTSIQDGSIDPIEDFLFNRKKGHCKYFATALALMLRAVDVPARLVSGYKGGTVNAISGHFEVEQRHAHAWVEVYSNNGERRRGYWFTLDPTPEAREESVQSFAPSMQTAHDLASFVKGSWSRYVVNLEYGQQTSNFYEPLLNWARQWWFSGVGGRVRIEEIWADFYDVLKHPSRWFSFQGAAITFVLLLLAASLLWLAGRSNWFWKLLSRIWHRSHDSRRIRVAFYERFESLCANLGVVRERTQTQREFGDIVRQRLERFPTDGKLGSIPAAVVSSFYQVRFGTEELSTQDVESLEHQLSQLEQTIITANGRR